MTAMVPHWYVPSEGLRYHGSVSQMDLTSVDGTVCRTLGVAEGTAVGLSEGAALGRPDGFAVGVVLSR